MLSIQIQLVENYPVCIQARKQPRNGCVKLNISKGKSNA